MCTCIYIYINAHIYAHKYIYIYVCMYICTRTYMCASLSPSRKRKSMRPTAPASKNINRDCSWI